MSPWLFFELTVCVFRLQICLILKFWLLVLSKLLIQSYLSVVKWTWISMCICVLLASHETVGRRRWQIKILCVYMDIYVYIYTFIYVFMHIWCYIPLHGAFKISSGVGCCDISLAAIENVPNSQENSEVFLKSNKHCSLL